MITSDSINADRIVISDTEMQVVRRAKRDAMKSRNITSVTRNGSEVTYYYATQGKTPRLSSETLDRLHELPDAELHALQKRIQGEFALSTTNNLTHADVEMMSELADANDLVNAEKDRRSEIKRTHRAAMIQKHRKNPQTQGSEVTYYPVQGNTHLASSLWEELPAVKGLGFFDSQY